jgi:quinol monooxygenase YgiN
VFVAIAIHHAAPEHEDAFIDFMRKVIDATVPSPGLLEFKACRAPANGFLAGYSVWEDEASFRAALAKITSLGHLRKPEWTTKDDELITLVDV